MLRYFSEKYNRSESVFQQGKYRKKALITGIPAQGGTCLAELLFEKGYEVHGLARCIALKATEHKLKNVGHLLGKIYQNVASRDNVLTPIIAVKDIVSDERYHMLNNSDKRLVG